jgi:PhnB protein
MPERALDERLDQAIDALLAGLQPPADPEIAALSQIAASLKDFPDESFEKRLKSDLQRRAAMPTSAVAPVREGFHTVTPYITVAEGSRLIDFLKHTFGAEELVRHASPAGFHAL